MVIYVLKKTIQSYIFVSGEGIYGLFIFSQVRVSNPKKHNQSLEEELEFDPFI